jgi:hypothetical protein
MKRLILAALLLLAATNAFALARTVVVVDDVIRMSKAGVGDDEIIAFVKKSDEPFDVSGDDVIAMTDARVSRAVVKAVIDESAARMRSDRRRDDGDRTRTRTVYVSPYWDPWYYDPFYYSPRLSFGLSFGSRWYGGYYGGYYGGIRHGRRH